MFHGSLVAIITPMHGNGEVDYPALERLIDWHLQHKTDGIVLLGTTGESVTIEKDERAEIIERVVKQVNERAPLIVGTGANATNHAIDLTRQAMELGADAALLVTPYYNKPTQEGLYQHFKLVASTVPLPQILYNVPSRTGCDLLPETVARLAKVPNIVAIKEATGSMERLDALLPLKDDINLLSGDDPSSMEFILRGGRGVVSVAANIAPAAMHEMCKAALEGDRETAERINNQLKSLYKELAAESNPIPAKWALKEMGMVEEGIRLPLTPLAEQYRSGIREVIKDLPG